MSMRHHNNVVADFEPLVKLLPPSAVASPLRSTAPLVDFWRTASGPQITQMAQIQQGRENPILAWRHQLHAGIAPDFLMVFRVPNR